MVAGKTLRVVKNDLILRSALEIESYFKWKDSSIIRRDSTFLVVLWDGSVAHQFGAK